MKRTSAVPTTDPTDACPIEPDPMPASDGGREVPAWRFRLAVLRHRAIVYRVAQSLLQDRHEAEDASQEAYLKYWQQGGGVERPREWLLTVVRNLCLDRLRRRSRFVDDEAAAADGPAEERDPEWHVQQAELGARLRGAIAALPEPQRSLVVLFDVHGIDGAACARILGLSTNQVKVYLHRARRKLRTRLEESS